MGLFWVIFEIAMGILGLRTKAGEIYFIGNLTLF